MSRPLPQIHATHVRDDGQGRQVEELDLEFSNGERRRFHRVLARGPQAICVVPMLDADTVLLLREYAAGVHRYELGLASGLMHVGESIEAAANRELMEEAGYGARELTVLRALSLSPRYMQHEMHVVLARDLYPQRLPGDEPEPLDPVPMCWDELESRMLEPDFSDGRVLAALFIARAWMQREGA